MKDLDTKLDGVLSFVVDEDIVVERMLARGRADDTEDVIRNRLRVYRDETSPLFELLQGQHRLRRRDRRGRRGQRSRTGSVG